MFTLVPTYYPTSYIKKKPLKRVATSEGCWKWVYNCLNDIFTLVPTYHYTSILYKEETPQKSGHERGVLEVGIWLM